jgi:hypothetical protein
LFSLSNLSTIENKHHFKHSAITNKKTGTINPNIPAINSAGIKVKIANNIKMILAIEVATPPPETFGEPH